MAKDVRELREEASVASAEGKHKKALAAYLELERLEPRDAQWAKRAGETYRRLGNNKQAVEAFERSVDRFAQNGFLVQAIAVCKVILQIDARHAGALERLALMNSQVGQGPTKAQHYADANPLTHDNPNVAAIRRATTKMEIDTTPEDALEAMRATAAAARSAAAVAAWSPPVAAPAPVASPRPSPAVIPPPVAARPAPPAAPPPFAPSRRPASSPPPLAVARTKSKPITLAPGMALDSVNLAQEVETSYEHSSPGMYVIPIDDDPELTYQDAIEAASAEVDDGASDDGSVDAGSGDGDADAEMAAYLAQYGDGGLSRDTDLAGRGSMPMIEIEEPGADEVEAEVDDMHELELGDIEEEVPLGQPRSVGALGRKALSETPLFAGLPAAALEALVEHLTLVTLEENETLFHEGDPGDALYVIAEGEVSVQAEGPPRVEMVRLGAGAFIGEVALMTDQPRSATVVATTPSELIRIDRTTLSNVLAQHGDVLRAVLRFVRDRLVDRWMRTSPLFRPFAERERNELAGRFQFLEIDAGTRMLSAGVRPDGLYIVLAGQFDVARDGATVAVLGPGDLIGENALLAGGAFKSDVVARGKSLALCLPASVFREVIMTHPHVLEYVGEQAEQSRRLQIL